ncbi:MAG TPA: hypothetical protein PLU10_05870 [Chitinophagaceae bacterium]|nr:hypothetical protein [Chitinophagaceae bacterium]
MKKIIFCSTMLAGFTLTSFAQERVQGFYLNPNLNVRFQDHSPQHLQAEIRPELSVGYLTGRKNRHNVSLTTLGGSFGRQGQTFTLQAKYSYDILLLRKSPFTLYASPFIQAQYSFGRSTSYGGSPARYRNSNLNISTGIAPTLEYRLGRQVDLIASTPLIVSDFSMWSSKIKENGVSTTNQRTDTRWLPRVEANVGIRINLFQRKKIEKTIKKDF